MRPTCPPRALAHDKFDSAFVFTPQSQSNGRRPPKPVACGAPRRHDDQTPRLNRRPGERSVSSPLPPVTLQHSRGDTAGSVVCCRSQSAGRVAAPAVSVAGWPESVSEATRRCLLHADDTGHACCMTTTWVGATHRADLKELWGRCEGWTAQATASRQATAASTSRNGLMVLTFAAQPRRRTPHPVSPRPCHCQVSSHGQPPRCSNSDVHGTPVSAAATVVFSNTVRDGSMPCDPDPDPDPDPNPIDPHNDNVLCPCVRVPSVGHRCQMRADAGVIFLCTRARAAPPKRKI